MTDENTTVLRTFIIDLAKAYEDQTLAKRAKVAWDILDRMDDLLDSEERVEQPPVEQPVKHSTTAINTGYEFIDVNTGKVVHRPVVNDEYRAAVKAYEEGYRKGYEARSWSDDGTVFEDHHRSQLASLTGDSWMVVAANMEPLVVEPPVVKPPGHTCPAIDKVIEATRKIKWRIDKPERHHEMADLCLAIFVLMEQVREENRQMRAAHADMQRRILDV